MRTFSHRERRGSVLSCFVVSSTAQRSLPRPQSAQRTSPAAAQPTSAGTRAKRGAAQRGNWYSAAAHRTCCSDARRGMRRAAPRTLLLTLLLALLAGASGANYAKARPSCCLRSCIVAPLPALTRPVRAPQHRAKRYGKNPRGGGKFDAMVRPCDAQAAERACRGGVSRCTCAERPTRRTPPSWRSAESVTPPSERACAAAAAAALGERHLP